MVSRIFDPMDIDIMHQVTTMIKCNADLTNDTNTKPSGVK